jgi:hypothetical protein
VLFTVAAVVVLVLILLAPRYVLNRHSRNAARLEDIERRLDDIDRRLP